MSWMDSWSRPSKSQATPAPYYLIPGGENTPYCHSCGRVISQRRTNAATSAKSEAKYCSSRCKSHKPGKLDREIEKAFVSFLNGDNPLQGDAAGGVGVGKPVNKAKKSRKQKGDQRILVPCSAVEDEMFLKPTEDSASDAPSDGPPTPEPELDTHQHATVVAAPGQHDPITDHPAAEAPEPDKKSYIDPDVLARMSIRSGTRIRPPQDVSEVGGSVGGEKGWAERIEENEEMLEKRRQGLRKAKEKEMVKCAARRGVVFGFAVEGGEGKESRRLCEAVMNGKIVEPSFAKGDWGIRWRE